jgi:hypothetical protein
MITSEKNPRCSRYSGALNRLRTAIFLAERARDAIASAREEFPVETNEAHEALAGARLLVDRLKEIEAKVS